MKNRKKVMSMLNMFIIGSMVISPMRYVEASEIENTVFINEIESNDTGTDIDWIEIMNTGNEDIDISGWFVTDDKGLERLEINEENGKSEEWRIAGGTVLQAGEILVIEQGNDNLGLGKEDTVSLYDSNNTLLDSYTYSGHAGGTYSRVPDGTGEFVDLKPTKGELNIVEEEELPKHKLLINEINSAPDDWVEFINIGTEEMDLSGYEIRDNSNDHRWKFPEGTKLQADGLFVVEASTVGQVYDDQTGAYGAGEFQAAIGIGSGDSIRLYDVEGNLLDEYSWTVHASYENNDALASYGRYPDGTGSFGLMKETKGLNNEWYKPQIVINEVESDGDATDWVEIYNVGTTAVDLSGWHLYDDDPVGHAADITPVVEGTVLNPGGFYVFDQNKDFTFGLGKADKVTIFNKDGVSIAEYSWALHANGVYARIPDGTGELIEFPTSTKGKANVVTNPVALNEVQSNDSNGGPDWIELANPTGEVIDISGIVIKDNDDTHQYVIPEGTTIPASGFLVLSEETFGFGLGKNDSVRLFENERLIASTTWADHTNPTWGLYPDVTGREYRSTKEATPGEANKFEGIPEMIAWPGNNEVVIFDTKETFLEDSSGLDFFNGQLYAVDNGTGKFWILDVSKDGKLSFAKGFENGKRVRFQKDADNAGAAGPDAEGITVDKDGFVYIASERDNHVKGVNFNMILKVDPRKEDNDLVALQQWDLTASLPQVSANMGIEAVEWVSNANVDDKLYDQNTNTVFDATNYPDAISNGVFFVALEDNGHVYAYVLNEDGSSVQIADMDGKIGGAMALDYDTYEHVLWVVADDGYGNRAAKITLNGESNPEVVHIMPASGVDISANNEGFAIAEASYTKDGQRPVYRFKDGDKLGSLSIGSIASDYKESDGSTGGPGGGNNGAVIPTPDAPTVEQNRISVTSKLTQTAEGSIATAALTEQAIADAIASAESENGTETTVEINVEAVANAKTVELMIPNKSIGAIAEAQVEALVIASPIATITFDDVALKRIAEAAKADVKISASVVDSSTLSVSAVTKERIANRPVFDFTVKSGDEEIADFNGGLVSVSVPYTLQQGENPNAIVVYYLDKNGKLEHVMGIYDVEAGTVKMRVNHFSSYVIGYNKVEFADVLSTQWYADAVNFVAARQFFNGVSENEFAPNKEMTRAMFAKVIANIEGADLSGYNTTVFVDVDKDAWYGAAIAWASDKKIVSGVGNERFNPGAPITREQMAVMLHNYMEFKGIKLTGTNKPAFADANAVSDWAKDAVTTIQSYGIISGIGGNTFAPKATADRAAVATVFKNLVTEFMK
ncbi:lamin tail domain-containing protein [Paenibacillus sp. PAMC21692]|uniref:lamin tail domain-containing protein n=1 Tax=Paenibacillus sp. PAMC21692 TaxID=2762320 RepID=UPI00164DF230|nr:lamin tail domain-containing protein [Paenibacillus sp. PAMC21692]QNK60333.1 lamin tail domain-containing protein [Paenibacillus sp. PAMC21692]